MILPNLFLRFLQVIFPNLFFCFLQVIFPNLFLHFLQIQMILPNLLLRFLQMIFPNLFLHILYFLQIQMILPNLLLHFLQMIFPNLFLHFLHFLQIQLILPNLFLRFLPTILPNLPCRLWKIRCSHHRRNLLLDLWNRNCLHLVPSLPVRRETTDRCLRFLRSDPPPLSHRPIPEWTRPIWFGRVSQWKCLLSKVEVCQSCFQFCCRIHFQWQFSRKFRWFPDCPIFHFRLFQMQQPSEWFQSCSRVLPFLWLRHFQLLRRRLFLRFGFLPKKKVFRISSRLWTSRQTFGRRLREESNERDGEDSFVGRVQNNISDTRLSSQSTRSNLKLGRRN